MKSLIQLANDIGVSYWRIKYLHSSGKIEEPMLVGGIRIYSKEMCAKIENYFKTKNSRSTFIYKHNSKKTNKHKK